MKSLRLLLLVAAPLLTSACLVNIPLTDRPCETDGDCLADSACVASVCAERIACEADADCPDDRACGDGACRAPREASEDGGPDPSEDAGGPGEDAGPGEVDAGPGDTDAGPGDTDAGPGDVDAGPGEVDAGPGDTDAGPGDTDAGPADAGYDAGPADAGYDAGPADAGVVCHGDPVEVCAPAALVRKVCQTAGPECDPNTDFSSPGVALFDLGTNGAASGYLFLYGGRSYLQWDFWGTDDVTIVGEDGAALYGGGDRVIDVWDNARVTLRSVEISGDDDGDGFRDNDGYPVRASGSSELLIEDSRIGPARRVGIDVNGSAHLELRRSHVFNNDDGGLDMEFSTTGILENSLFEDNGDGGGPGSNLGNIRLSTSNPVLFRYNTVVSGNRKRSDDVGGVICSFQQHLYSSIVRNNTGIEISGNCVPHTSNIEGGPTGNGNMDADPLFDGSYHLQVGSPSINTGTESTSPDFPNELAPTLDFDYEPRPAGADRDMGFDEVQ